MSILSGYGKFKRYVLTDTGYKLCSQWTSSNTVQFDDGNTAQSKLGAINGITDSFTSTSSNVALSAKSGKNLQDQITALSSDFTTKLGGHTIDYSVIKRVAGTTTTMTQLFVSLSPCICMLTTENVTDKPSGKYGTILIFKYSDTRAGAICICTDGTVYHNAWNASTESVTGWKQ